MIRVPGYYGGKNPHQPTSKWIAGLLGPFEYGQMYVEPFAGMLGVLMTKPVSYCEIANDKNGFIASWWLAVRDYPEEFGHRVMFTPFSRKVYNDAVDKIREGPTGDVLEDGVNAYICILQSVTHGISPGRSGWAVKYTKGLYPLNNTHVHAMYERMKYVQLENRDAVEILDRVSDKDNALVYVDPPYRTADIGPYGMDAPDWGALEEVLKAQKGKVALSGYNDEWDILGWERSEKNVNANFHGDRRRVEVLWTNYSPRQQISLY